MKILLVNSLIFGSVLVWPMTASLHHGETSRSWLPISLTDQAPGSDYVTSPVKVDEVVKTIMATGTLIPAKNVDVGSVLSGQIRKLCVDFNDKVVRGQVLAELDERSFDIAVNAARAALENARAEVRGAEARLERAAISVQQATLQKAVLEARVDRARVALDVADRELKRKLWLQERNAAPLADVQDSQSRRDAAAASLRESKAVLANQAEVIEAARADLKKAKADIAGTRSNAEKAAAQLQSARIDLERTKIRSPIDGIVVGRTLTEGQTLATSLEAKTLFIIAGDLKNMEINARVDESDISKIKVGQDATFTVDAFPGRTFEATVKQIRMAPQVVQNVVTYTVVLTAANDDYALLPGMTVLAKIVTRRLPASVTVPLAALRFHPRDEARGKPAMRGGDQASLWVLQPDGPPRRISVVRGDDNGRDVVIKSDELRPDDRIVVGQN
ncbi:MAG: efflux RND transporter periplasmic adaptor subunit [Xanthobacteraceae bacterium]|nr:efflux RND transporter periplasmic adaptor subunit [Xanthobacteraceae bacterium]